MVLPKEGDGSTDGWIVEGTTDGWIVEGKAPLSHNVERMQVLSAD